MTRIAPILESVFDIIYLVGVWTLLTLQLIQLEQTRDKLKRRQPFIAFLGMVLLALGETLSLGALAFSRLIGTELFTGATAIGAWLNAQTVTLYLVSVWLLCVLRYNIKSRAVLVGVPVLALTRFVVQMLPHNNWGEKAPLPIIALRVLPFLVICLVLGLLFYRRRRQDTYAANMFTWVAVIALACVAVEFLVQFVPIMSMMSLLGNVAILLMMWSTYRAYRVEIKHQVVEQAPAHLPPPIISKYRSKHK